MPHTEPQPLPINGELDLHLFKPREAADLVKEYLIECRKRGIFSVRVVHGKGKGVLMHTVHRTLDTLDFVADYRVGWGNRGSWGATLVELQPPN